MTGASEEVCTTVLLRSGGRCERCRAADAADVHHRRPRGMGGSRELWVNLPANLVALCRGCHRWAEENRDLARRTGWLVSQFADDAESVPLVDRNGWSFSIDNDGNCVSWLPGGLPWGGPAV